MIAHHTLSLSHISICILLPMFSFSAPLYLSRVTSVTHLSAPARHVHYSLTCTRSTRSHCTCLHTSCTLLTSVSLRFLLSCFVPPRTLAPLPYTADAAHSYTYRRRYTHTHRTCLEHLSHLFARRFHTLLFGASSRTHHTFYCYTTFSRHAHHSHWLPIPGGRAFS